MNYYETPSTRKLRGYAFDPSLSLDLETFDINEIEYLIQWEDLDEGYIKGEYLDIIDYDPTIRTSEDEYGVFYKGIDLNQKSVLANNGLAPSESNPLFHQQMVYAVAMTTIENFERALGRKILWAKNSDKFVKRLRIYPHAFLDANAFYSPQKKAILFGYFKARPVKNHIHMPNSIVFTCLSHDIIAHEVTHAILDGLNKQYAEATNPDVHAFHEAFADIVALLQRFSFAEVLQHQIRLTRGDLSQQNLLGQLAKEMGSAIGNYGSLRDYLGETVEDKWIPHEPNPEDYQNIMKPHKRGAILVSAIFESFLKIYKNRTRDLIRIASNGTGVLPDGEIHPDLVNRLSKEAAKTAKHFLNICIRAIDYCPPVDITFGDYLRALITADSDLVSNDDNGYRLAIIESFKRRGVYPKGIRNLSVESLCYSKINYNALSNGEEYIYEILDKFLKSYINEIVYEDKREEIDRITNKYIVESSDSQIGLHSRLSKKLNHSKFAEVTGIYYNNDCKDLGIRKSELTENPAFYVFGLRTITKTGPDGKKLNQALFSIIQTARFSLNSDEDSEPKFIPSPNDGTFKLRGGATMIFDLNSKKLKYIIGKPLVKKTGEKIEIDKSRLKENYDYISQIHENKKSDFTKYFVENENFFDEPFAILHNQT